MYGVLTRTWWLVLLRGLGGATFGAVVLARPQISLEMLALAFGAFAVVDGTLALLTTLASDRHVYVLGVDAVGGLTAGLVVLAWPAVHAQALLVVLAAWAAVRGVAELWAARCLRRQCPREASLLAAAVTGLVAATLLATHPTEPVLVIGRQTGAGVAAAGVLLTALALRLCWCSHVSRSIERSLAADERVARGERTA